MLGLRNIFRNSQFRLFLSGTFFTVAFVWMAISSYDVDGEEIRVFLILSFIFVGGLIVCGFLFSLLLSLRNRNKGGLLGQIDNPDKEDDITEED
ncbi:MAG: hypothetical protein CMQ21_04420 [Gammaproteobacteria bacterium]|nr:hypothetical protein [Gammaproteobacteria bacterium]